MTDSQRPRLPIDWRAAALRWWWKALTLSLVIGGAGTLYWWYGDRVSLEELARHEAAFREFHDQRPLATYAIAFGLYVAVTALSLPLATVLTLVYAWLFQSLWRSLPLISFASTTGALLAFLLSRYLLREFVTRWYGDRLAKLDAALRRDGAFFLLSLRLLPVVPFFVINLVMGLTPIRAWTFWWCTQIGTLPGTAVYAYAGSRLPSLNELAREGVPSLMDRQLFLAFALLAVMPFIVRTILRRFGPRSASG